MRGIVCYYSGSGNTRLACRYIKKRVRNIELDLFDLVNADLPDLAEYDLVGLATFADFFGPPRLIQSFIEALPRQNDKPVFVFNTFGRVSGRTLRVLDRWVTEKGFLVAAGHSLHTPESYPPWIVRGLRSKKAPKKKAMSRFNAFIAELDQLCADLQQGCPPVRKKPGIGLINSLVPVFPRTAARWNMGAKYVEAALCTRCGICAERCPYQAIKLDPLPVFAMERCYGCWRCYNQCPEKAIYTRGYRGIGHYPEPLEALKAKLGKV